MTHITPALVVVCAAVGCSRLPSGPGSATGRAAASDSRALDREAYVLKPVRDVRPPAVWWEACVLGIVRHVDREKKVITIEAPPENWRIGGTA